MSALKDRIASLTAQIEFDTRLRAELMSVDTSDTVKKAVRSYTGKKRGRKPKATADAGDVNNIEIPEGVHFSDTNKPLPDIPPMPEAPEVVTKPRRMRAAPSKLEEASAASEAAI